MQSAKRKHPVGVQSFESIRKDGLPYIYKTPLIYKIITNKTIYSPLLGRGAGGEATLLVSFGADVVAEERNITEWKAEPLE